MGKRSSTQITATFLGDGLNGTFAPAPLVNTPSAPAGGPVEYTLAAATPLTVTPPADAKGFIISPGTCAGYLQVGSLFGAANAYLVVTETSLLAWDFVTQPTFDLLNAGGGTIYITWI